MSHTITAVPGMGSFVVRSAPGGTAGGDAEVHVTDVTVTASQALRDLSCGWLIGVTLGGGVSGSVTHTTVEDVRRGPLGCQQDIGVYVDNPRSWPATRVKLGHNTVTGHVEQGLRVQGNVDAQVSHNRLVPADEEIDDHNVVNGLVFGLGYTLGGDPVLGDPHGRIANNHVTAVDNDAFPGWAAAGISLYQTGDVDVAHNVVDGHADVGIGAWTTGAVKAMNNTLVRGDDDVADSDEFGVGLWFQTNSGTTKAVRNVFSGWNEDIAGDPDLARANRGPVGPGT